MCSLMGIKVGGPTAHEEKIGEYLDILEERGDQSFGYFYVTPDNETYFNKSLKADVILRQIKEAPKGSWCFIHARKASVGMVGGSQELQLARAHPVESDDELITLLHNGTNSSIFNTVKGSISDSQGLATLLSIAWEGRRDYYGDIGVVLYERQGAVYLYKDGIRPLVMSEDNTIFASEPISDKVKWKNVENTYDILKGSDVKLDLTKEDLGLKFGKLVDVTFDIATHTVHNYSVKGMPKTSVCSICKKTHLKQLGGNTCCVCKIEGRKAKSYKKPKNLPTTTSVNQKLPKGVVSLAGKNVVGAGQVVMYTSDFNLLKQNGYPEGVSFQGGAVVKADYMYRSEEGHLMVLPKENGKFTVKLDRVFVDMSKVSRDIIYHNESKTTVVILGKYKEGIKLSKNMNLTVARGVNGHGVCFVSDVYNAGTKSKSVGFIELLD